MSTFVGTPTCLLRFPQVKQRVGLSRSVVYERISRGDFPAPINLGGRAVAWLETEIDDWINDRVKACRDEPTEVSR